MAYIVSYQKHTDELRTVELVRPLDEEGARIGTELATIDGVTYVSLPTGSTLSAEQPEEIAQSIVNPVTVTDTLRAQLKAASPHLRLIANRMIDQIRESYTVNDELYLARLGVGASTGLYTPTQEEMNEMTVYGEFVESVREWGRAERAKFGL